MSAATTRMRPVLGAPAPPSYKVHCWLVGVLSQGTPRQTPLLSPRSRPLVLPTSSLSVHPVSPSARPPPSPLAGSAAPLSECHSRVPPSTRAPSVCYLWSHLVSRPQACGLILYLPRVSGGSHRIRTDKVSVSCLTDASNHCHRDALLSCTLPAGLLPSVAGFRGSDLCVRDRQTDRWTERCAQAQGLLPKGHFHSRPHQRNAVLRRV